MAPPLGTGAPLNLDVEAISGICGSISIACWVVVFSPQILENFRRSSADGLSLQFIIIWLLGDLFNIWGAVLQGVLPTMIILAIYYTIADVVLLAQCLYYRGFDWRDEVRTPPKPQRKPRPQPTQQEPDERTSLLTSFEPLFQPRERRGSNWSHLSPVPVLPEPEPPAPSTPPSTLQTVLWNTTAVMMVVGAGIAGWWLSRGGGKSPKEPDNLEFNTWGQVFGWFCAVLYLGSRIPQLVLNWRRKSTEGVSMLFFLFACLGNLTYVLSIIAFEASCLHDGRSGGAGCARGESKKVYWRYILVNLSWLAGSLGTLFLDLGVFVQFFMYSRSQEESDEEFGYSDDDEESVDPDVWAQVASAR
ncbi:putative vacuolar amino acid transporter YPQ3 [Zalerion maritima]|uniref:Vacuolar amino acid transporter YPQ3 n=1 Tax=Zalerion maritima TaxID=339359 RepID=A0AAD5RY87_9PEZI|nr:putative vacuolar amino acid transporter YPQ3 [Zalerion maritima]